MTPRAPLEKRIETELIQYSEYVKIGKKSYLTLSKSGLEKVNLALEKYNYVVKPTDLLYFNTNEKSRR